MNKRGESMILETTIFLVLNVVFFVVLLVFVSRAGGDEISYGEMYAKQIALVIDNAKPGMTVLLNIDDAVRLAEKNNKLIESIFSIEENRVKVSLSSDALYDFGFFSDYNVSLNIRDDEGKKKLEINIKRKDE